MRRSIYLLLLVILVTASASALNASTNCERWFVAYRSDLAHSRQIQRLAAAKRRAKLYAVRKIAQIQPKPRLGRAVARGPRMSRPQTLRRIDLACGVLPEGTSDQPPIAEETLGSFSSTRPFVGQGVDLLPTGLGEMIAANELPAAPFTSGVTPDSPLQGGTYPYAPGFGGGGVSPTKSGSSVTISPNAPASPSTPGTTGSPSSSTGPDSPSTSGVPVSPGTSNSSGAPVSGTPTPPVTTPVSGIPSDSPPAAPVVPEPSSYILVLTGLAGAAGAIRRRFTNS